MFLAVGAQFLNAVVALIDKYIVSDEKTFPKPFVYAFYTCLISGAWIVVYFFGLIPALSHHFQFPTFTNVLQPTLEVVALSFLSAYTFFTALTAMFTALKDHDASDIIPVIGAVSALGTFGLGYFFFGTVLSHNFMFGIVLLALGTFLVSRLRFPFKTAMIAVYSGMFFALHYITFKGLATITSFDNGFFWSRIAFMFFALTLLMIPNYWDRVHEQTKKIGLKAKVLIVGNKLLAGIASILILKATDLGDPAVVQALGGIQYVFILAFGIIVSIFGFSKVPAVERYRKDVILQKAVFVTVITIGFLVLFR